MHANIDTLLADTQRRAVRYLQNLNERSVAPTDQALAALRTFDIPLQDNPIDPGTVLAELDDSGSPGTVAMAGPRYFGFVIGGAVPAALAADWLVSTWDQNNSLYRMSPVAAEIERVTLRWILELLRLPPPCAAGFVTGTTAAHVVSLTAARNAVLRKVGWDVDADGLFGAPPVTVVVGGEAHATLFRALSVVGLGRSRVRVVPVDAQGRMRADALPDIAGPAIVCAQAGNVNTGASDPMRDIVAWARARGAWVHVDGAFGLWARVAPSRAPFVDGVEDADSWATDAHKWLNAPYDGGFAIVRDADALRAAVAVTAAYLPAGAVQRNPSDFTLEHSRRARAVPIWAALRSLGRSGIEELVERNCRQARHFAAQLSSAHFSVLNEVVLNQVLVSFGDAARTRRVVAALQAEGTMWAGETVWQGHTAMRISVSSWATTDADVQRSVDAIIRVARAH